MGENGSVTVLVRAATRGSDLALWQTHHVGALLSAAQPDLEIEPVVVSTGGDRDKQSPIHALGGKGIFAKEVQAAVLDGRADIAVHSAKDLPSVTPDGLVLACVPVRGDARDALVGSSLAELPTGGRVATGSARRRVQLAHRRPDLTFTELRGNIATRLSRAGTDGVDAVVTAVAAVSRLGMLDRVADILEARDMVPQVGQGALAVECRADDDGTLALLAGVQDTASRRTVDAERGFLAELGGDCDLPAGAHARAVVDLDGGWGLELDAVLASLDGHVVLRHRMAGEAGSDPAALGRAVARHLLDVAGGSALLERDGPR
jgi:hydroxymethylbilane synthase